MLKSTTPIMLETINCFQYIFFQCSSSTRWTILGHKLDTVDDTCLNADEFVVLKTLK
jgi:hypothetical protein